jgi:hypothetical protein
MAAVYALMPRRLCGPFGCPRVPALGKRVRRGMRDELSDNRRL